MKWILTGEINSFHLKAQSGWAGNEHSVPKHCEKKEKRKKNGRRLRLKPLSLCVGQREKSSFTVSFLRNNCDK